MKKDGEISGDVSYVIEKNISQTNNQSYTQYKISFIDKK
jgi:hypothetical protein